MDFSSKYMQYNPCISEELEKKIWHCLIFPPIALERQKKLKTSE